MAMCSDGGRSGNLFAVQHHARLKVDRLLFARSRVRPRLPSVAAGQVGQYLNLEVKQRFNASAPRLGSSRLDK
jgi:hypothetical protein